MQLSMTWPQYLRRQVRLTGKRFDAIISLTPRETEMVLLMLMRRGCVISDQQFVEFIWPDPDDEPQWPETSVGIYIYHLRKKLPGIIQNRHSYGHYIPHSIEQLTPVTQSTIMIAVETTTEQETEYNGQGQEEHGLQDQAHEGAGYEEYLRLQERLGRRTDPFALHREERLFRRRTRVNHGNGRRGLTRAERRRLQRRVDLLLRIYPHLRARS